MRRRILISILLVIAATVLTLGVPLAIVSWRLVDDILHRELASGLDRIATSITDQAATSSQIDLRRLEVAVPADGRLTIRMPGQIDQSIGAPINGEAYTESLVLPGGGQLKLSVPAGHLRAEQLAALGLVGLAVVLSIVVGTSVALVTARRLATPASDVARRAARLGTGDFRVFPHRYGIAELDRVADVLDTSATDIAALIRRERDLAGDISHQLRTRLTGLRLRLEELATHPDPAVQSEVAAAMEQTDRLVGVVDDLLANARSERASGAELLALDAELRQLAATRGPDVAALGRKLDVTCSPDTWVRATGGRLREALGVLIDNALQHGAGTIRIAVRPGGVGIVVEVSDEGRGVPVALIGHIFERGVSTASSTGIGLGLARAFIEADGGRLELLRPAPPVFGVFLVGGKAPTTASAAGASGGARSADGGGAVVDPDGGGAAVDPDGGGAVVDPDGGGAVVDPDGGGAVVDPPVAASGAQRVRTQRESGSSPD